MRNLVFITLLILVFLPKKILPQACSDPGLCTIGTLFTATAADTVSGIDYKNTGLDALMNAAVVSEKFNVGAEMGYGGGDRRTSVYSLFLRGGIRIKEKIMLGIKIPYVFADGDLGSANGLGDITINWQHVFKSGNNLRMAYTFGMVIPTNDGNLKAGGESLPMVYQSSLGFYGAMAGVTMSTKRWNMSLGYQQNFGRNGNEFITDSLILDPMLTGYDTLNRKRLGYGSSKQLQNGGDVMLRIEHTYNYKKLSLAVGVLPIYRVTNSTIILENGKTQEVAKSGGLTFNLTGGLSYRIDRDWLVGINGGFPVINRKVAPDGLRRHTVILLRITRKFW
ncbi:MAG: hypothetical protein AB7O73_00925 [Bacteroidia bacterium]